MSIGAKLDILEMSLESGTVNKIYKACLATLANERSDLIAVEVSSKSVIFSRRSINEYREEIHALLAQLPDEFMANRGDGANYLNAIKDSRGLPWTSSFNLVEQLVLLGIAIGAVQLEVRFVVSLNQ